MGCKRLVNRRKPLTPISEVTRCILRITYSNLSKGVCRCVATRHEETCTNIYLVSEAKTPTSIQNRDIIGRDSLGDQRGGALVEQEPRMQGITLRTFSGREYVLQFADIRNVSQKDVHLQARRIMGFAEKGSPISLALLYIGTHSARRPDRQMHEIMPARSDWKHNWYGYILQIMVNGSSSIAGP